MTVTELRDALAKLPADAEVWIDDSNRHFAAPVTGLSYFTLPVEGRVYLFPGE